MSTHATQPIRPEDWWRFPCRVTNNLIVTGDLDSEPAAGAAQLDRWVELGVTHVVDVRGECSDEEFVAKHAPHITYIWAGTHDSGHRQSADWFDGVLAAIGPALDDRDAVILVHCHMGVNRGPSMALRLMLEQGNDAIAALAAIRASRPIAGVLYAADAVDDYHRCRGSADTERARARRNVTAWLDAHPIDSGWVISRIRLAG